MGLSMLIGLMWIFDQEQLAFGEIFYEQISRLYPLILLIVLSAIKCVEIIGRSQVFLGIATSLVACCFLVRIQEKTKKLLQQQINLSLRHFRNLLTLVWMMS